MIVVSVVPILNCRIAENGQGVKFMKILRQGVKTSMKNLRIWTASLAMIALILSISSCGGGGGDPLVPYLWEELLS